MFDVIKMKSIAQDLNNLTYTDYFYRLMLLSRSIFKWENLPNGISDKWIEKYLFAEGSCIFFDDKEKGFMIAKHTPDGILNPYDEPITLRPYGTNYNGKSYENAEVNPDAKEKAVLIRNNDEMIPTSPTIQLFALRLAEISRTIDININAQKTPVIILCDERQRLTLQNVYKKWNGFEPVIYGEKNLNLDGVKVLKTDAPIVFDKLQYQKHSIWNECMTFLGINNANQDKRERLVDDEVQANNQQVYTSVQIMLKSREEACKLINKFFGTNISVSIRQPDIGQIEGIEQHLGIDNNMQQAI